jgi:hypothetical protein
MQSSSIKLKKWNKQKQSVNVLAGLGGYFISPTESDGLNLSV